MIFWKIFTCLLDIELFIPYVKFGKRIVRGVDFYREG